MVSSLIVTKTGVVASGSEDKTIRLWNLCDGKCVIIFHGHDGNVSGLTCLKDGLIASCSEDNSVRVWDESGVCRHVIKSHTGPIISICKLVDGRVATASWDLTVRVFNVDFHLWKDSTGTDSTEQPQMLFSGNGDDLHFISDSEVISKSSDGIWSEWNIETLSTGRRLTKLPESEVRAYEELLTKEKMLSIALTEKYRSDPFACRSPHSEMKRTDVPLVFDFFDPNEVLVKVMHNNLFVVFGTSRGKIYVWKKRILESPGYTKKIRTIFGCT